MVKLRLPLPAGRNSGGGSEVYSNFEWAESRMPELFSNKDGSDGIALILRNNAPSGLLLSRGFLLLPQNAWAWIGCRPTDAYWKAKRFGLRVTGDLSIARAQGVIRLSESIPTGQSPSLVLPNVLSEHFDELLKDIVVSAKPEPASYIYSFGNFIDYRNYESLIRGVLATDDSRKLIIHGGVLSASYLEKCILLEKQSEGRVQIDATRKSRAEILRYIYWSDGVVFPSSAEASPISLLETVALGKAVICNDIPGHRQSLDVGSAHHAIFEFSKTAELSEALRNFPTGADSKLLEPLSKNSILARHDARECWLEKIRSFVKQLG